MAPYPASKTERDRWIVSLRNSRNPVDPAKPFAFFLEEECDEKGDVVSIATVLLTNRECPWKCVMCDLWKNTLTTPLAPGLIPTQIAHALSRLDPARRIKLYNSGSFFDSGAIPPEDFPAIAALLQRFEKVIVECHPSLMGEGVMRFRDLLKGRLEVAMGLETAHPGVLQKLNKGMTLELFGSAAAWLRRQDIDLRAFILVAPPFLPLEEALGWATRSIDFAFEQQAGIAALILTRAGNGAMDELKGDGFFEMPELHTLEAALEYGVGLGKGLVVADLWNLRQAVDACTRCFEARRSRLHAINLTQRISPRVHCESCRSCA